jgi:hypothetical protein
MSMSPTILSILFALAVVILLSSLPWLIGAVMDRRTRQDQPPMARMIRDDDVCL